MLDYQSRALASLRASNARFVAFAEYASRSYDALSSVHASRVSQVRSLRDSLMDIFVRVRHLRMRLHERVPGDARGAYREDEDEEAAEVEQLKRDLIREQEEEQEQRRRRQQQQQHSEGGGTSYDETRSGSTSGTAGADDASVVHSKDAAEEEANRRAQVLLLDENLAAGFEAPPPGGDGDDMAGDVLATDRRTAEPSTDPSLAL